MREPRFFENPGCAEVGGNFWFPEKSDGITNTIEMKLAISICKKCPHQSECAEWGIKKEVHGIWGGLTEPDRRRVRKNRSIRLVEDDVA